MRKRYFWKNMYREIEDAVRSCEQCARNNDQERTRVNKMQLFTAHEPLEFVAIDILGPFPKRANVNLFLLVISDCFSKITRTIPMRTTTALAVAKSFCTHWVFSYGPPRYLLSDNGTQFYCKNTSWKYVVSWGSRRSLRQRTIPQLTARLRGLTELF
jgi:hypothetical protein